MAGLFDKLANVLMPEEEVVEEEKPKQRRQETADSAAAHKVERSMERPFLTVHTNKVPELKVKVFVPEAFDQANVIANTLRNKEAVIVNYEKVSEKEQRRLCDFLNGSCYILKGGVQRISDRIVLYVPAHVEISKELCAYSVPEYVKNL